MKLDGKFSYLKENQRTLSFNVDIRRLPRHKTVFAGSSSKRSSNIDAKIILEMFRQLQRVRVWSSPLKVAGPLHPVRVPPLRHVRHDVLGLLLCAPGRHILTLLCCWCQSGWYWLGDFWINKCIKTWKLLAEFELFVQLLSR